MGSVDTNDIAEAILEVLRAELGKDVTPRAPLERPDDDPALKALTTQALPAISELVEAGSGELLFEATDLRTTPNLLPATVGFVERIMWSRRPARRGAPGFSGTAVSPVTYSPDR